MYIYNIQIHTHAYLHEQMKKDALYLIPPSSSVKVQKHKRAGKGERVFDLYVIKCSTHLYEPAEKSDCNHTPITESTQPVPQLPQLFGPYSTDASSLL